GDLLIEKATQGVKVRLLCWLDDALIAQISEASMPEYGTARIFTQNETHEQRAYDWQWYRRAKLPRSHESGGDRTASRHASINAPALDQASILGTSLRDIGIEVVTR